MILFSLFSLLLSTFSCFQGTNICLFVLLQVLSTGLPVQILTSRFDLIVNTTLFAPTTHFSYKRRRFAASAWGNPVTKPIDNVLQNCVTTYLKSPSFLLFLIIFLVFSRLWGFCALLICPPHLQVSMPQDFYFI